MRNIAWDNSFRRAFKKEVRRDRTLEERILDVVGKLANDPFDTELKTHKLRGQLAHSRYNCESSKDILPTAFR